MDYVNSWKTNYKEDHMMFKRGRWISILIGSISAMFIFGSGFVFGFFLQNNFLPFSQIFGDPELNELFKPYIQAWEIIHEQYVDQPVDDVELIRGSINGLMNSLDDPYTAYMDPDEYEIQSNSLQGEYTGIGAWVDTTGEYLTIMSPMPDSPAEEAGLEPGDQIVGIDGEDVTSLDPVEVLQLVLGPAGTKVELTVQREGSDELLQFSIGRAVIPVPSVESEILDDETGYLRLYTFGSSTSEEAREAVNNFLDEGVEGLILDLRNNTGGYVDAAIDTASIFIEEGTIMIEEWGDGTRNEYNATGEVLIPEMPMVVIVNGGSASASEIVAGALQDYGRAELVGTQTFGKGLIQNWIPLVDENGAVRITTARWLTPDGRQIQGDGLTPDVIIELSDEDITNGDDIQLERAKSILEDLNK